MAAPSGLIVAWPSTAASIPSGWSRVSALDSRFPKGSASSGTTGGATTHTHTTGSHLHSGDVHTHSNGTSSGGSASVNGSNTAGSNQGVLSTHTHAIQYNAASSSTNSNTGGVSSSGGNMPAYYTTIWIQSNGTTDIPVGAVCWWNASSAPTNWSIADGSGTTPDLRNKFLYGAAVSTDGGTNVTQSTHTHTYSHNHTAPSHSHSISSLLTASGLEGGNGTSIQGAHTHGAGSLATTTNSSSYSTDASVSDGQLSDPSWTKLYHIQKTTTSTATPANLIAITVGSVPGGWVSCNGSNSTPNLNGSSFPYVKGANSSGELGTTGGGAHGHTITHSHNVPAHTHTSSGTSATGNFGADTSVATGSGITFAADPHTHTGSTTGAISGTTTVGNTGLSAPSLTAEPPFSTATFIQSSPVIVSPASATVATTTSTPLIGVSRSIQPASASVASTTSTPTIGTSKAIAPASALVVSTGEPMVVVVAPIVPVITEDTFRWDIEPTPERIAIALAGSLGPVTYNYSFELRTKANQFLSDVSPAISAGSISADIDRATFRTATFTIDPAQATINPLSDHLAVFENLLVDNSYPLKIQLGLFALVLPDKRFAPSNEVWTVAGNDLSIHLIEQTTTAPYSIASGENYITGTNAITDLLDSVGLRYAFQQTTKTLPVAMSWPVGTQLINIVNDLLHGINYYSLWFDAQGIGHSRQTNDLSQQTPDVVYTDQDFILIPIDESGDTTTPANQIVASITDPSRGALYSVATNDNPDDPMSTVVLGRTITLVVDAGTAADQATLDAITANALQVQNLYRKATMLTQPDPRRDAHEVYQITVNGVYDNEIWWARNWALNLKVGDPMTHTIAKVTV